MKGRKTGGRRKGTPNKVTAEARAVCSAILDDPTYRTNLTARARAGTLSPAVEAMLWHYAFGKPRDSLNVTIGLPGDLSELSTEELLQRVDGLREQVREQAARERALPAEYRTAQPHLSRNGNSRYSIRRGGPLSGGLLRLVATLQRSRESCSSTAMSSQVNSQ